MKDKHQETGCPAWHAESIVKTAKRVDALEKRVAALEAAKTASAAEDGKYDGFYFLVVEECLYPSFSQYDPQDHAWPTRAEALAFAKELAEAEVDNFVKTCELDPYPPAFVDCGGYLGYALTPLDGKSDFFYFARVLPVRKF